uniref:Protein kinase domain-containing protein n=1 Tax=Mesocestoides corti TaxID=53468 RepID=A0A5K3G207_MESCO
MFTTARRNVDATKIAGSAYCTAPECLHKVAPYSPAADIFAFGLLVCELITRLVNNGSTIPRTAEFGLDRDSLPVSQDCPAWFLELAVDCCKVEHQERPSVEDIVDRIMQHSLDRQAASPLPVNCSRAFALASGEKEDAPGRSSLKRYTGGSSMQNNNGQAIGTTDCLLISTTSSSATAPSLAVLPDCLG